MKEAVLTVLAFMLVSFAVQGLPHFVINADHFATIPFMRGEPILPMGFAGMIIQALVFSFVMSRLWPDGATLQQGLIVSGCSGLFLASYIALAEPAKYAAPSIGAWVAIEGLANLIQFGFFGVLLWHIYRNKANA